MPVYMKYGDIGGNPAPQGSLAQLVTDLRQRSGEYVLTSVAHGVRDQRLQLALQELHGLGVPELPARVPLALESSGLGYICIEARSGRAGATAPLPVLLVIAQAQARGLLIPAVQKVRDAASRMQLPAGTRIYLGGGGSAPAAKGPSFRPGNGAWFLLSTAGNDHEVEYDILAAT